METDQVHQDLRVLDSEELLAGKKEILIRHKNDFYRLIVTKAGKLILNK